jgi:hypothetical protein
MHGSKASTANGSEWGPRFSLKWKTEVVFLAKACLNSVFANGCFRESSQGRVNGCLGSIGGYPLFRPALSKAVIPLSATSGLVG